MYVHLAKSRDEKILSIHVGELQHLSQCRHISCKAAVCTATLAALLHIVSLLVRCSQMHVSSPKPLCVLRNCRDTPSQLIPALLLTLTHPRTCE